jgi:hypothetical protein
MRAASAAYQAWVETSIAPIAHASGLSGKGPLFRRRDGDGWIVFGLERRRLDPNEATALNDDLVVEFRFNVGASLPAARPAWDDRKSTAPNQLDLTVRSPSPALEPPEGDSWYVFRVGDEDGHRRLTQLVQAGLPEALAALGSPSARAVLDQRLAYAGPLEDLVPGHAEELLKLADAAGADDVRTSIVAALRRDPVTPHQERWAEAFRDMDFGPGVTIEVLTPPADDGIWPPMRPGRRLAKSKAKLLADLASDRVYPRRIAATRLGGWDGDDDVVSALRLALTDDDGFTRLSAASSLGHLGDAEEATWSRVLGLADDADAGPDELAQAIVLLARLDPARRTETASGILDEMVDRYPAWTRRIRGLRTRLTPHSD